MIAPPPYLQFDLRLRLACNWNWRSCSFTLACLLAWTYALLAVGLAPPPYLQLGLQVYLACNWTCRSCTFTLLAFGLARLFDLQLGMRLYLACSSTCAFNSATTCGQPDVPVLPEAEGSGKTCFHNGFLKHVCAANDKLSATASNPLASICETSLAAAFGFG